ncbi:MAG: hypothetical protein HYZ42_01665 [Bacteroidetes bacterium]|nr:hypothetical protein [Bacteroidota bacterium]
MKALLIPMSVLCLSTSLFSQGQTETRSYIRIDENREIIKVVKTDCPIVVPAGSTIKTEKILKNGNTTYTITSNATTDSIETTSRIKLESLPGNATLRVSADSSYLEVNYWLNPSYTFIDKDKSKKNPISYRNGISLNENYSIAVLKREISCETKKYEKFSDEDFDKRKHKIADGDTTLNLWKVSADEMNDDWFLNSDQIVAIYEGDKIVAYYANKYDRNGDYRLELGNREYFSAVQQKFAFGPLTVPFKYRLGYTYTKSDGTTDRVKDEISTGLNIGLFGGYQIGKYRTRYEKGSFKKLPQWGGSVGGFFTISSVSVDSSSSTSDTYPLTGSNKSSMGIFSPGFCFMGTANNISMGLFVGWDVGFGQDAKRWDYNNRPWIGFGFNYNLTGLFWQKAN